MAPAAPINEDVYNSKEIKCASITEEQPSTVIEISNSKERGEERNPPNEIVEPSGFSNKWTSILMSIRKPITKMLLTISGHAARSPKAYIIFIICLSFALITIGFNTNFYLEVDENVLWTPVGSRVLSHGNWIDNDSTYSANARYLNAMIHASSNNVLGKEGVKHTFTVFNSIRALANYDKVCQQSTNEVFVDENGDVTCQVISPTKFWNNQYTTFQSQVANDNDVINTLSQDEYPDGTPVNTASIIGNAAMMSNGTLVSAQSYFIRFLLPPGDDAETFETDAINKIVALNEEWTSDMGNVWNVEVFAERSFSDEFTRAIVEDIPLIPLVFLIMSLFCCVIFARRNWIFSRSLLGFGAVVSVLLAILSGYGVMFLIGIPFTSMTQILPFIMFGIGLDNAFIIYGAYERTNASKSSSERIEETMEEAGVSIFVTTLTSVVAFSLGCSSSIPGVYWLCMYAFPTLFVNFLYQITFFIAIIVIDERRIDDRRRDCIVCCTVKNHEDLDNNQDEENQGSNSLDRLMIWYGDILMKTWMKVFVLLSFLALSVGCAYSASQLKQEFKFTELLPKDSYASGYYNKMVEYSESTGIRPYIYFRDVDQSDGEIQVQMENFVEQIAKLKQVTEGEPHFDWLSDFKTFVSENYSLKTLPFNEQLDAFLAIPVYEELYSNNIVRDVDGNILTSRVEFAMETVDQEDVADVIKALKDQRAVSEAQSINAGKDDWSFFTFGTDYYIWEFYSVAVSELILTTILGIVSVTVIGALFIPHWSAIFYVFIFISVLYVDLLGVLQFSGVTLNSVSYIALVMSIGLMVDFVLHMLLRYFESTEPTREGKVKETLRTMGTSIFVGTVSTFLGVIPLAFSSSEIFSTIFIAFMALVTLGAGHGLILMPVLLSLTGATESISVGGRSNHNDEKHRGHTAGVVQKNKIDDDDVL